MFINANATFTAYDRITYNCFRIAAFTARTIRVATSAAKTFWKYARPVLIVSLAIALVLGFKVYQLGESFRAWCDRLVSQSITVPTIALLMPALDTLDAADKDVSTVPGPQELLAHFQQKKAELTTMVVKTKAVETSIAGAENTPTQAVEGLERLSIRQLKKLASEAKIPGYSGLNKASLVKALSGSQSEQLIAPTYNERWAVKREAIAVMKPGALHYPEPNEVFAD